LEDDASRRIARNVPPPVFFPPGAIAMSATLFTEESAFIDRRDPNSMGDPTGRERRQFVNSHDELSPDAAELARAIDTYKLSHRRRFINFEEMLSIVKSLGYRR
jgi:hypothetical protein